MSPTLPAREEMVRNSVELIACPHRKTIARQKVASLAVIALLMIGCGPQHPVVQPDAPGRQFAPAHVRRNAIVRVAKPVALARYRGFAVISPPDCRISADEVGQLKALGFFEEVVGQRELPGFVAGRRLLGNSASFDTWGDYQALARAYKPFLLLRFQCIRQGDIWYRLSVIDPEKVENLFVSEVKVWSQVGYFLDGMLTLGGGMTVDDDCVGDDEDVRLPLYSSLLEWINANR